MTDLRELIARKLAFQTLNDPNFDTFDTEDEAWAWVVKMGFIEEFLTKADAILAIIKAAGYVKLEK